MPSEKKFKEREVKVQIVDEYENEEYEHASTEAVRDIFLKKIELYLSNSYFENSELDNVHIQSDELLKLLTEKYNTINESIAEIYNGDNFKKLPFPKVERINGSLKDAEYVLQKLFDGLFLSFSKGNIEFSVLLNLCETLLPILNTIKKYNENIFDVFSEMLRDFISNSKEETFNVLELELQEEVNSDNEKEYNKDANGSNELVRKSKRVIRLEKLEKIQQKFISRFTDIKMRRKRLHDISFLTKYILSENESVLNNSKQRLFPVKDEEKSTIVMTTEKERKKSNLFAIVRTTVLILIIMATVLAAVILQLRKQ